jgi:hypothetical protein
VEVLKAPLPIPVNSCFGGELFRFGLPKLNLAGFDTLYWEPPNRLVGGGPAGVEETKDRSGGGPAGVVEGISRLERRDSGVEGVEEFGDGARNIAAVCCLGAATTSAEFTG